MNIPELIKDTSLYLNQQKETYGELIYGLTRTVPDTFNIKVSSQNQSDEKTL